MIHFVQLDESGRVINCGTASPSTFEHMPKEMRLQYKILDEPLPSPLPGAMYWENGGLVLAPERPSDSHEFNYSTKQWELNIAQAWQWVRHRRDQLLAETDWLRLRAIDSGEPVPQAWLDYRQALRDVTEQEDPLNIVWPSAPE